ncbi:MAG: hypothetical protein SPI12_02550 [Actinomycetaceae bacterium]|nr:hypothetical protein [Actinomycetaceae bacterium]MDY6082729.1 hypothetical protein [Actinomycetaceae bacterium]
MGYEGYVVGLGVLLVLAYVLPYMTRRSAELSTPRRAHDVQDARVIRSQRSNVAEDADAESSRGSIFFQQPGVSMPSNNKGASAQTRARELTVQRQRAEQRRAKREENRRTGVIGVGVVVGALALTWMLVVVAHLALWGALLITGVGAAYCAGFGYVAWVMQREDRRDAAMINQARAEAANSGQGSSRITHAVRTRRGSGQRKPLSQRDDAQRHEAHQAQRGTDSVQRLQRSTAGVRIEYDDVLNVSRLDAHQASTQQAEGRKIVESQGTNRLRVQQPKVRQPQGQQPDEQQGSRAAAEGSQTAAQIALAKARANAAKAVEQARAAAAATPSYTLKPLKRRSVKPFVPQADEQVEATHVPYRPRAVGERFAADNFAADNAVAHNDASGNSDTTSRVGSSDDQSSKAHRGQVRVVRDGLQQGDEQPAQGLQGGSALDSVLARRRA